MLGFNPLKDKGFFVTLPATQAPVPQMLNLPNTLTVLRIFFVPFLVGILLAPPWALLENPLIANRIELREMLAVVLFLAASLTDWLDGWLARRRNQVTTLGALLDPLADKLLMSAAFIALVEKQFAPAWMVIIIVGRELAVTGLRSVASSIGVVVSASIWGKYKTVSQVVAIVLLILTNSLSRWGRYEYLAVAALWVVMTLALVSAADYFFRFYHRYGRV
jgi:CDP-diacylglycerol---glycerol-3-phosphate 3-phosphatidyltransferase